MPTPIVQNVEFNADGQVVIRVNRGEPFSVAGNTLAQRPDGKPALVVTIAQAPPAA